MKTPSRTKIGFDFSIGGFILAVGLVVQPFDGSSVVLILLGLLWIAGAAVSFDNHY